MADVIKMAEKINKFGGKLYLVGGAVRNMLLNKTPKDFDYCVTGISFEEFSSLFPEAISRGKAFPVFDIDGDEFALARKEIKTAVGHKGFNMITNKDITIEDDLLRRDITINSIAKDVLTDEIIDPYGGKKDIENKIIRATSEAFLEDPLRVYRVARFAAELDFTVEEKTLKLMEQTKNELLSLSAERVAQEFERALHAKIPSKFFKVLREANCLDIHFVEIFNLIGVTQPIEYHPEGDVFNHTMIVLDIVAELTNEGYIIFGGLVHDFGKALTPKDVLPKHIGHEKAGVSEVKKLCDRLKLPNKYYKAGITACLEHMRAGIYGQMTVPKKVDFLTRVNDTLLGLRGIEIIATADKTNRKEIDFSRFGEQMIKEVNAKAYPKGMDFRVLKDKVRQERINWLKRRETM